MNTLLKHRIASSPFRWALFLGVIGAVLTGFILVNTVTSTNLGTTNIRLAAESFVSDADVVVEPHGILVGGGDAAVGTTQATATEMETGIVGKLANTALPQDNFAYSILVKEAAVNSFLAGEVYKIEVYSNNGTTNILRGTLYCKQDSVDAGAVEGCQAAVDLGSTTSIDDSYNVIVTQVAP